MEKMNKEKIRQEVKKLDPMLKEDDETFKIAEVLLSSLIVGPDVKKIGKFLDIKITPIRKWERRLRANKIWVGQEVHCDWFNKKSGSISFWMAVLCAQGFIKVVDKKEEK